MLSFFNFLFSHFLEVIFGVHIHEEHAIEVKIFKQVVLSLIFKAYFQGLIFISTYLIILEAV